MNQSMTIGIDLAKTVFFAVVLDQSGKQIRRKKLRRHEVLPFLANHPGAVVVMESCSGAHHWAQLDQSLHRLRQSLVAEQTRLVDRSRALLVEHGLYLPEGKHSFRRAVVALLEDAENGLPWRLRELLGRQYQLFLGLEQELAWYEQQIRTQASENETCQRLMSVPGYGPIVAATTRRWWRWPTSWRVSAGRWWRAQSGIERCRPEATQLPSCRHVLGLT